MTDAPGAVRVMRTLFRIVTALAAVEGILCLYVLTFGGIRVDAGPLRISAGTWRRPLTQALVLAFVAFVAFWLYWRDAVRHGEWDVAPRAIRDLASRVVAKVLDFAGVNRGEVIRLWIFVACLFQVPAAYVCVRLQSRMAFAIVLMLTIVQSALATATFGFVVP